MTKLIYVADPMCSWCYGFGPELTTLLNGIPDTPLEIVLGGLRAKNTEPMQSELKATLLSHWAKVEERSGLPFCEDALSHPGFIYDTEPACRAVATARIIAPRTALDVFHAIQHGFYALGLDTTQGEVLSQICTEEINVSGGRITADEFLTKWESIEAINATKIDFLQTQHWEITGFPTLLLEQGGELFLVSSGFARTELLVENLQALVDQTS